MSGPSLTLRDPSLCPSRPRQALPTQGSRAVSPASLVSHFPPGTPQWTPTVFSSRTGTRSVNTVYLRSTFSSKLLHNYPNPT